MRFLLGLLCVVAAIGLYRQFGALTNKPYAFAFRAWELESVRTPQPFDPWLDDVQVDIRGTQPLRTLPVRSGPTDLTWLPDSTRFAFDGLQYQRQTDLALCLPADVLSSSAEHPFSVPSWAFGVGWLHYLGAATRQSAHRAVLATLVGSAVVPHLPPVYFPSPLADLKDRAAVLAWGKTVGGLVYESESASYPCDAPLPCDLPPLNELLRGSWGTVLLAGIDVRAEFPKIYLLLRRLQRASLANPVPPTVFTIGPARQSGLNVVHLGSSISILLDLVTGRHWLSGIWMKRFKAEQRRHLMLVGALLWCDAGGACLHPGMLRLLDMHYGVDVYPLFPHVGWIADVYLGVTAPPRFSDDTSRLPLRRPRLGETDCVLFPGQAVVELTPYVPSDHQDVHVPTLVLPTPAPFLERESVYMSHAGRVVRTVRALAPPVNQRGVAQCREQNRLFSLLTRLLLGRGAPVPTHPLAWSWSPRSAARWVPGPKPSWSHGDSVYYLHRRVRCARVQRTRVVSVSQPHLLALYSLVLSLTAALVRAVATNYPRKGS
jgi:hypothetical protein